MNEKPRFRGAGNAGKAGLGFHAMEGALSEWYNIKAQVSL